jgi:adenylate cyclase
VGRFIRYWYTYRTFVAVLIALVVSGSMYWLYTQQIACDIHSPDCHVNISLHPEDRFAGNGSPDPHIVIAGIDNASIAKIGGTYPITRDRYAQVLQNLENAGASVVAFDIGFPDHRDDTTDGVLAEALMRSKIPVILAYGGDNTLAAEGKLVQTSAITNPAGIDLIPLKEFRCADSNHDPKVPCQQPLKNVILASVDVVSDADGVLRRIPMFVQPACYSTGACSTPVINTLSFATYRADSLGTDFQSGPALQESGGAATFGTAWTQPLQVDTTGSAIINYSGPPDSYKSAGQYVSFGDLYTGSFSPDKVNGKIVLVGDYYLNGVHDEFLATSSKAANATQLMAGVEMHANVIQMLRAVPPTFLSSESPLIVLLVILVLGMLMALVVARVSVLIGLGATIAALVVFTVGMVVLASNASLVPDLFHPWLTIGLTYTGVTAYRFLYEDREKRKVTALFGQFLKPEIVAQLAKTRGGVDEIMRGGERRDITLLFVDIRGFTSMSESMSAHDVVSVIQLYLDHLSGIIFTWDGTLDKYVGDEIVAFWNAPRDQENHALLAVRCAYDLINRAPELQAKLLAKGLPPVRWGIGVNTGHAVVGNLGSRSRLQYTALGDTVNTAARFCANAPAYHLLIGQPTYEMCKDYIAVDMIPGVQLKGKSAETFRIYQVTAIRETPTSPWVRFPTEMATEAHQTFSLQYTQKSIIAAGNSASPDILIGAAAEDALAAQASPAPETAPTPTVWPTPPTGQ